MYICTYFFMSEFNLKEVIKTEYVKCSRDASYFLSKYCFIQHPKRGRMLFNLYPFQRKVVKLWDKHDYTIINKSRQLGISTLVAGYALWMMIFQPDKNVLCIATKQDTARNLIKKVQFMYGQLPSWLRVEALEDNKLSLRLENGSEIKAATATGSSARSEAVSLLIIDEAAFIERVEEIWGSAQQTLANQGKCIVVSTPYNTGNWFHRTYTEAETSTNPDNSFLPIRLPWNVHPERDEEWRRNQEKLLGDPKVAAQELDAEFSTSGDMVFLSEWLKPIEDSTIVEPVEKRGVDKGLWIWEQVDYAKDYIICADSSRGDGKDYSAAQVIDPETNEQIAEYRGMLSPKEFGYFLVALATEYNNALLVVENNNMGWATLDTIISRGYDNLYYSLRGGEATNADQYFNSYENTDKIVPGLNMSMRMRPLIINKFREYVAERGTIIKSKRLLEEMKVFIWKNGRPEAQYGYNDDLIMSYAMGMYLRDTSLKYQQQNLDLTRQVLGNIQSSRAPQQSGIYSNRNGYLPNPYEFKTTHGQKESLTWLL